MFGIPVVQVVRSVLKIPNQLACFRIECEIAICVEVIAGAASAVGIGERITGRPVEQAGLGIVRSGEPGGASGVGLVDSPEAPGEFAGGDLPCTDEATNAFVASRPKWLRNWSG